jgi:glycosyltransferase involved in cell wall biosynthesis
MNILYTNFHTKNGGGHTTYILALAKGLNATHRVTIASPEGSCLLKQARAVTSIKAVAFDFKPRFKQQLASLRRLRRLIVEGDFNVVHVNGSADHRQVMLATLGMLRRPAIIFTKHNDYPVRTFGNRLRAWFGTTHSIAVSDYVSHFMQKSAYRAVSVVKHGVAANAGHHPALRAKWQTCRADRFETDGMPRIVLGSVAGTGVHKGWMSLVDALASLPAAQRARFSVIIAGEVPPSARLDELRAKGVLEQFHFVGLIADKNEVFGCSDLSFVLSHRETLSYACREAMSAGLPVMVADSGGLPENIDDGVDGWIVPVRNAAAIARVLETILAHPEKLVTMGQAARQKSIAAFDFNVFLTETEGVYREAQAHRAVPKKARSTVGSIPVEPAT